MLDLHGTISTDQDYILEETKEWITGVTKHSDGRWSSVWLMKPDAYLKLLEYRKKRP